MLGGHAHQGQKRILLAIVIAGALAIAGVVALTIGYGVPPKMPRTVTTSTMATTTLPTSISAPTTTTGTSESQPITTSQSGHVNASKVTETTVPRTPATVTKTAVSVTPAPPPVLSAPTTTTVSNAPVITYSAYVDPRYTQSATNPLAATFSYSAGASTSDNGVNVELASLPSGTLSLMSDGSVECTMNVGVQVSGSSCPVTYATFGSYVITAEYTEESNVYTSATDTDAIAPYSTTTVAVIKGGGSEGGLLFDADVTDSNGNAVTTGTVSMTVTDVTQGWSYVVTGAQGMDGADQTAFSCIFIENYPKVGDYSGCGLQGQIQVTPGTGDELTLVATYVGTVDWTGSASSTTTYTMPS